MTIQEIAILIESIEKEFAECVRCGMCQSVCPLYNQTRLETDVARGKLAIIEGLRKQLFFYAVLALKTALLESIQTKFL